LRFPTSSHINNSAILTGNTLAGSVDGDDDDENDGGCGGGDNVGLGKEGDF
jgi:hypothetical protein